MAKVKEGGERKKGGERIGSPRLLRKEAELFGKGIKIKEYNKIKQIKRERDLSVGGVLEKVKIPRDLDLDRAADLVLLPSARL